MLQYLHLRGYDGRPVIQRVDRLTAEQLAAAMDSPDLLAVTEADQDGATHEDARTGRQRRNGQDHTGPSIKAKIKSKARPPKKASATAKGAK
jgi:hypothetical protein